MKIASGTVVTLKYDLCTDSGEIIETSDITGPVTFLFGTRAILPGLDSKLEGLEAGDEKTFEFEAKDAFGTTESAPTKSIGKTEFPDGVELKVGARFEAGIPGGQTITLEVAEVNDEGAEVRMLHPLVDKNIAITVKVVEVRAATDAEKEGGRVISTPPPIKKS